MGNESEGWDTVGLVELFSGYAVKELVPRQMDNVGARRFCQGTMKESFEGFCYRRVFRRTVTKYPVFKNLEMSAARVRKAVGKRLTLLAAAQQAAIANFHSRVEYDQRLGCRSSKRDRVGRDAIGGRKGSC